MLRIAVKSLSQRKEVKSILRMSEIRKMRVKYFV